jgi:hypothetical protein
LNYLFYIAIPNIVIEQGLEKKWWTNSEIETLIQSIKRKDFKSKLEKEIILEKYDNKLEKKLKSIDISKINLDKFKKDNNYFKEIFLDDFNWLFISFIKEIYSIKIDWEEDDELDRIVNVTSDKFNKLLDKLGITEKDFKDRIFLIKWYDNNRTIIDNIIFELKKISSNLNNKIWFPTDRYFRNDELYIFDGISDRTNKKLKKELLYIRNNVLLIFYFWRDKKLYRLPLRLEKYNFKEKFLLTNFFKYSKYIKKDKLNYKY